MVNSNIIDNEIILWEDINVGVAVALQGQDVPAGMFTGRFGQLLQNPILLV